MENRVVLLGAGASNGAREEPRPPLGKELHQRVLRYFEKTYNDWHRWENEPGTKWKYEHGSEIVRQRLKDHLKNASSYESLADTLLREGKTPDLTKLNYLLARYMTPPVNQDPKVDDSFLEKPDLFDEWLKKTVRKRENLKYFTIITLNYDCLLERAICRFFKPDKKERQCLCTHVHYPFIGGSEPGVEVLKLHGSINWIGDSQGKPGRNGVSLPIVLDGTKKTSTYKNIKVVSTCFGETDDRDPSEILIATYAHGKPLHANPTIFQDIRKKAIKKISEGQKIEIIGVHIPLTEQDDPTLWELFQSMRGKNVDFINPSEKEKTLAKLRFGFNPIKKSFKEFVDSQS
jgi:hypothetical protein